MATFSTAEHTSTGLSVSESVAVRSGAWYLRLGLLIALGLSIAWQAALAGQFLSGQGWALSLHAAGANAVVLLGIATLGLELVSGRRRHRWGMAWLAGLLTAAILTQYVLGYLSATGHYRLIAYHVLLGVSIAGLYVFYLTVGLRPAR